jgi:hypothetical protein
MFKQFGVSSDMPYSKPNTANSLNDELATYMYRIIHGSHHHSEKQPTRKYNFVPPACPVLI